MTQPAPDPRVPTAAVAYLVVAGIAATILGAAIAADLLTPLHLARGVAALLAAVIAVAGYGFLVRCAEDRLTVRLDQMEQNLTEQREQGYASGFVDGAAGNRRHLTAVGDA